MDVVPVIFSHIGTLGYYGCHFVRYWWTDINQAHGYSRTCGSESNEKPCPESCDILNSDSTHLPDNNRTSEYHNISSYTSCAESRKVVPCTSRAVTKNSAQTQ